MKKRLAMFCKPSLLATASRKSRSAAALMAFAAIVCSQGLWAQPVVSSLSAASGTPGLSVTISGSGFNTTAANNVVYFGATRAAVTSAGATSLVVTVPVGATYAPVSVTNTGTALTGYSIGGFTPAFTASSYTIPGNVNFESKKEIIPNDYTYNTVVKGLVADIDGDGKTDAIYLHEVPGDFDHRYLSITRNISTAGTLGTSSFADRVDFSTDYTAIDMMIMDMNGDGKPDIVVKFAGNGFAVYKNTSTSGSITTSSFSSAVYFGTGGGLANKLGIGDINGDGKPDVVYADEGDSPGDGIDDQLLIYQNTSTGSSISFSSATTFAVHDNAKEVVVEDLDNDGHADVIVHAADPYIFRNTGIGGAIGTASLADPLDILIGPTMPFGYTQMYIRDMDGDNKKDLVFVYLYYSSVDTNDVIIYRNTGMPGSIISSSFDDGHKFAFGNVGYNGPSQLGIDDINGDGKPDIITYYDGEGYIDSPTINYELSGGRGVSIYRNTATSGAISSASFAAGVNYFDLDGNPGFGMGMPGESFDEILAADIDGDTKPDLVFISGSMTMSVARNSPLLQYPVISSLSGYTGAPGSSITVTGSHFNTVAANNLVYFGTSKAVVSAASATSLTVTVPGGATFLPVSVTDIATGLTAYSKDYFLPTYSSSPYAPGVVAFDPKVDFATTSPYGTIPVLADADGDGKLDMITFNIPAATVAIYRNTSTSGSVTAGSFAAPYSIVTYSTGINNLLMRDLDGDGKPEIIISGGDSLYVLKNTSTSGSINSSSFATKVGFTIIDPSSTVNDVADVDGDGRPDIISVTGSAGMEGQVFIYRNRCSAGTIDANSFAGPTNINITFLPESVNSVKVSDLDGDGKADIVLIKNSGGPVLLHNNTRPGAICGVHGGFLGISYYPAGQEEYATIFSFEPEIELSAPETSPYKGYYGIELADMNGDGKKDIIAKYTTYDPYTPDHDSSGFTVFLNAAITGAHFTPASFTEHTYEIFENLDIYSTDVQDIKSGDMNGDGKPDIVCSRRDSTISVILNNSSAGVLAFYPPISLHPSLHPGYLAIGDVDGDAKPDIIVSCSTTDSNFISVLRNYPSTTTLAVTGPSGVMAGSTVVLTATAAGGTWSSSDVTIATVGSTGVVTGLTSGTVTITYTYGSSTVTTVVTVATATGCGSWGNVGSAGFTAEGVTFPSVAINPATNAPYIMYGGPTVMKYTGSSWSDVGSHVLATGPADFDKVILDNSGTPYVIYMDYSNSGKATVKKYTGSAWVNVGAGAISDSTAPYLDMAIDPYGQLYAAYTNEDGGAFMGTVKKYNGSSWVTVGPQRFSSTYSSVSSIAVDGSGTPYVLFSDGLAGYNASVMKFNGATWEYVGGAGITENGEELYSLAIDPAGMPYIAYADLGAGSKASVKRYNGSSWELAGSAGFSAASCLKPKIQINKHGTPYVCYRAGDRATVKAFNGSSWVNAGDTSFSTGDIYMQQMVLDTAGIPYVAYGDATLSNRATVKKLTPDVAAITGNGNICAGSATTLNDATGGGAWWSSNSAVATAGSATGTITGIAAGTATISYIIAGSCSATYIVTVSAAAGGGTITGTATMYQGANTNLYSTVSGGTWSSSNTAIAITGTAAGMVAMVTGIAAGTATITYTANNGCGTGYTTQVVTVTIAPITGISAPICGGTAITLSNVIPGGTWSSGNTAVATVGTGTGNVTAIGGGTAVITYAFAGGSIATVVVTVEAADAGAITGPDMVATGAAITLSDPVAGGEWSTDYANATVSATGVVTGVEPGTAMVTYTIMNDCGIFIATKTVTINTGVAPVISGALTLCSGSTSLLTYTTAGGTWSSSNTAVAIVGSSGIISGIAAGTAAIYYTTTASAATVIVTVIATPSLSSTLAPAAVCSGSSFSYTPVSTIGGSTFFWSRAAVTGISNSAGADAGGISEALINTTSSPVAVTYVYITTSAGCSHTQSVAVTVNAAPAGYTVTGGGTYCTGGAGVATGLSGSATGITYQLYNGAAASGSAVSGTGSAISFGTRTVAGTYTVLATRTATACTAAMSGNAIITTGTSAGTITGPATVCAGYFITLAGPVTGGAWSSSNAAVATIGTGGIVTGIAAGTATISYLTTGSCGTMAITKIVTVNPLPAAGTITGASTVATGSTITLANTTAGGAWSSSNTAVATVAATGAVTGVATGTVTISYTVTNSCGTAYTTKAIAVTVSAVGPVAGMLQVCAGATTTLSDTTTGGAWSSSTPAVATIGPATGIVTAISAGTATITYTAAGSLVTAVITVSPLPATITGATSVCPGSTTALGNTTAGGAWSSNNITIADVDTTGIVTGNAAGTTTITYTLPTGCYKTIGMTVKALPAAIAGAASLCTGGTTTYTDATTGGVSWASSNAAVATIVAGSGVLTGVSAGTTSITYLVSSGCVATKTVTVTAIPAAISGASAICAGSTALFTDADGGGTWSSSTTAVAAVGSTGVVSGVAAGAANITYTLAGAGCRRTAMVTVNALPAAITGTKTLCTGSTTALTDATTGGAWSNGGSSVATVGSTGIVTGLLTGTAAITYTAATGCTATAIVSVGAATAAITGSLGVCTGTTSALAVSATGGTWSSSATAVATITAAGVVTGVSAGTATISYTLAAGCRSTAVVTVSAAPAAITGATAVCSGLSATFTSTTTGGTWSSSNAAIAGVDAGTGAVTGLAAGVATITYSISAGCYKTKNITINATPVAIGGAASICTGGTTTLTNATAGAAAWASSTPSVATIVAGSGVLTGVAAGTATITYTMTTGCATTTVITVGVAPAITGAAAICAASAATLSSGTGGGTWSSSTAAVATVGSSSGIVTGVAAGAATITYTTPGCRSTRVITVNALPAAITGSTGVCIGATSTLSSGTGGTWSSLNGAVATAGSATGIVSGISADTVSVVYTLATGCSRAVVATVSAAPAISGPGSVCVGSTATLSASPAGGTWSSSTTSVATIGATTGSLYGVAAGAASITYTIGAGCRVVTPVTVGASPAAITGASSVCAGATTTLADATPSGSWSSSNTAIATVGSGSGIVTGSGSGTVTISYATGTGCYSTKLVTVGSGIASLSGSTGICVGATATLSASVTGSSWSSSNTSVATVGTLSGVVTGVAPGLATITFTGTGSSTGCTTTLQVTVAAGVSLAAITGTPYVGVGATTALADATGGGVWSSSNAAYATVSSTGLVTGVSSSFPAISYTVTTGACVQVASVVVHVVGARPAGTVSAEAPAMFSVYPNPTSGRFTVYAAAPGTFSVYTLEGKELQRNQVVAGINELAVPGNAAAGIYMCRYTGDDGSTVMVRLVYEQ